jgi:L-methionine (R)-S-oxide reductase
LEKQKKAEIYDNATRQILSVVGGLNNLVARMATANCILSEAFPYYYWTGFYLVDRQNPSQLVVGPYQGTLGCLTIPFGKGVCGTAAESGETQIVSDVHALKNHIACDTLTNSEIVVPITDKAGNLIGVFDVDSLAKDSFDQIDREKLEGLMAALFAA